MVFVTVGTQKQDFHRIFELVEKSKELENEKIVAQTGYTNYKSDKMEIIPFLSDEEFKEYIKKSDIVICHGGVGTIFNALHNQKKIVAVPRLSKYKEHVNDHQMEVCFELEKEGYIENFKDGEDFNEKIKLLKSKNLKKYVSNEEYLEILRKEI